MTISWSAEATAKDNVEWVRAQPVLRDELKKNTRAFVFDIKTGKVEEVVV
jgi:carbonic anhydrase